LNGFIFFFKTIFRHKNTPNVLSNIRGSVQKLRSIYIITVDKNTDRSVKFNKKGATI